ncbi:MAG TPA: aminoglycoside phosphotransferase family protein [Solirubrobacteraceae bacterium]
MDLHGLGLLGVDREMIAKRERLDGARALRFLDELPRLVTHWQARLGLSDGRVMPGGVLSAAVSCKRCGDGAPVVLKLAAADAESARAEAAALAAWDGVGACALLYASDDGRVLLLDAICPGVAVRAGGDDEADARRAGALITTLHRIPASRIPAAVPDAGRELRWRFRRSHQLLDGSSPARGLVGHSELDAAYATALRLHAERPRGLLCHGDLVNKNILLDAPGRWWAIDPRPCVGDPCMDAGLWALTHRPGQHVRRRCELVARAAALDPDRIWAWARVFAVTETVLVTSLDRSRAHHRVVTGSSVAGPLNV